MQPQRAWLIDASIYIFRAWFSLPDHWHTADGWPVNAVYGYTGFLLEFLEATGNPAHCAAAFDESLGSCFRNDIYPDYKASRELPDEALAFQLQACREITERLGMPCYGGARVQQRLQEHWPQVLIARQLTGLEMHVPEVTQVTEFRLSAASVDAVKDYLTELGIGGPLARRCEKLARGLAQP